MIRTILRAICLFFVILPLCLAQTQNRTKLYPNNRKPQKSTTSLISAEQRVGNVLYQVFYLRDQPKREAFRIDIGAYDRGQLVSDWNYGIILEKNTNDNRSPFYVWYGGDDTGQRLLWFLPKDEQYECVDIFKSAEFAWKRKFDRTAPDLGEVFGDYMVDDVTWDGLARLLTVSIKANEVEHKKAQSAKLIIAPSDFLNCAR